MKPPGKTNLAEFSSSNKKVPTGPFLQIEITKIDDFASFLTGTHKRTFNHIEIKNSTRAVKYYKAD